MAYSDQDYRDAAAKKFKDARGCAGFEYDAKVLRGFRYAPETFEKQTGAKIFDTEEKPWFISDSEMGSLI